MLIQEALQEAEKVLRNQIEVEILFSNCFKVAREKIFAHPEAKISGRNFGGFLEKCTLRARGLPLAYLTHHKEFFGLDFYVDERVLIPRPETEILVEEVVVRSKRSGVRSRKSEAASAKAGQGSQMLICDVGTGSGCIAISLAKSLPRAKITAVDISENALKVAKKNAKTHDVLDRVEFVKSDLMSAVSDRHFDFIVANLPYIAEGESDFIDKEVLAHEPKMALFGGKTGLGLFEKLFGQIKFSYKLPATSYQLICEIGFNQRNAVSKLIKRYFGNVDVEWKKDLAGIDRAFILYV